jgi:hypothetical protein
VIRIARKEHLCDRCNLPIYKGQEYRDEESSHYIGRYRKVSIHHRIHLECPMPAAL